MKWIDTSPGQTYKHDVSSTYGNLFQITTFGESHGPALGVVIDGIPAGILLDTARIERELARRKPGQSRFTTPRKEDESFEILSGLFEGKTLGTPLALMIRNMDAKSGDYKRWANTYRPSHADYTYDAKYGHRTPLGGGRASARETAGRVMAGAIAGQILADELGVETIAWVDSIGEIEFPGTMEPPQSIEQVDTSPLRCPDPDTSRRMEELLDQVKADGDSVGGTIRVIVRGVPPGLGDPVFDRLEAELAKASLSIPACKGFESGSGFGGSGYRGSSHNDEYIPSNRNTKITDEKMVAEFGKILTVPDVHTPTNRSGGIQGGISNGMPLTMRLAFKPTATIRIDQDTMDDEGNPVVLKAGGRHDPCVLPRAVPIVESMVNLVLLDAFFRQRAIEPAWWLRYSKRYQKIAPEK